MWLKFCLPLVLLVLPTQSARILGVSPVSGSSHQNAFNSIFDELARQGHHLVVITSKVRNDTQLKTQIDVHEVKDEMDKLVKKLETLPPWNMIPAYQECGLAQTELVFNHKEVQELITGEPFDLVMVEMLFPEYLAFGDAYKCPTILLGSMDPMSTIHWAMGNPSHPVSHPEYALPFYGKLNLIERVFSTLLQLLLNYNRMFELDYRKQEILKRYFGESARSPMEMLKDVDLSFLTINPVLYDVRAHGPTTICVGGGFHLKPPQPLPKDLQTFADGAEKGFIYFSLGSGIKDLSPESTRVLKEIFKESPYKILWKSNSEIEGISDNVKIVDWVPQQDILRHKNIKLFITQGGMQSLEEGLFGNVPMLILPIAGDQFKNAKSLQERGAAKVLYQKNGLNKKETLDTMADLISNPKYKENAKKLVELALDQPMTGKEKVVWWTDYVLRNNGTKHLRNRSIDLPWYQFLLLDVITFVATLVLAAVAVLWIVVKFFKKMYRKVFGRKEKEQ